MYFNKIIPELSVTNLENSLKFYQTIGFKIEYERAENNYKIAFEMEENWYRQDDRLLGNKEFLVQDPDGYLIKFSEDLGEKEAE